MSVELDNFDDSDMPNRTYLSMESEDSLAKTVEVSIQFLTIGEVDTTNEKYQAEVLIRSRWFDDEEITVFDKTKNWYPKLFIENALNDVKEEITFECERVEDKTMVTETRISKGSFWERMELQNFPIDIQELTITLASKCKPTEVKLVSDTSRISTINTETLNTFRDQQKWQLYKMVRVSETASYDLGSIKSLSNQPDKLADFREVKVNKSIKRPKFVVTAFCSRRPGYYITNAYSFNFLITVLSLTIFVIETKLAQSRISGTFTLILTSVSFKMVTGRALPTISYMTSLDKYQIINIVYLVMCCVWHATISSIQLELEKKIVFDKIALACFACAFFSIQVVFAIGLIIAYQKVRALKKKEQKFLKQTAHEEEIDPYY